MAKTPTTPGETPFRRRIPLELRRQEFELLERAEARFGTKRATLVAGLEALARVEALEREVGESASACAQASAKTEALERDVARLARELEKAKSEAAGAARGRQAAERKGKQSAEEASAYADSLARLLEEEREARAELEEELEDARAALFDALRCPRCGKWAEATEWAVRQERDGDYVYHRPCGFHRGGVLDAPSLLGFRGR